MEKVFIPLCGIYHGMQSVRGNTKQDCEKLAPKGDGPALNGPAPAPQGGQAGQDIKEVLDNEQ
jgi:hypothetical protein